MVTMLLDPRGSDMEVRTVPPFHEMGAYEALWSGTRHIVQVAGGAFCPASRQHPFGLCPPPLPIRGARVRGLREAAA